MVTVDAGLLWAVIGGVIVAAVAWGKATTDIAWMKRRFDTFEKKLDALTAAHGVKVE